MAYRHRRGRTTFEESPEEEEDDAFSSLSRRNSKKSKTTHANGVSTSGAGEGAELRSLTKSLPLSTTSSMKRHHKEMSNTRKAKMDAMLMELQMEEQHKSFPPEVSRRGERSRGGGGPQCHRKKGSYVEPGEEDSTTNLYCGNLDPSITEDQLADLFRQFGDLYSVKIMWPRTSEERARQRHTGFVCFVHRADAEEAMSVCHERDPFGVGRLLLLNWGKNMKKSGTSMPIISRSTKSHHFFSKESTKSSAERQELLGERGHGRTEKELPEENREFSHGKNGSRSQPGGRSRNARKGGGHQSARLLPAELEEFHMLTRTRLTTAREAIADAMAFCFENSNAAKQIADLVEALLLEDAPVDTRIARLYLLSDILFNSQQPGVRNAFFYRDAVERMAPLVFSSLGGHDQCGAHSFQQLGRLSQNKVSRAVKAVLAAWTNWGVYNSAFLDELEARFEGKELDVAVDTEESKMEGVEAEEDVVQHKDQETQERQDEHSKISTVPRGGWQKVVEGETFPDVDSPVPEGGQESRKQAKLPLATEDPDGEPLDDDADGELIDGEDGEPLDNEDEDGEPLEL